MTVEVGLPEYALAAAPGDRTAIIAADGTGALTYRELVDLATSGAAGLASMGVGPRGVVALHLPNVPDFAPALFAVLYAGAAAALCSPLATEDELAGQLALTRATVVVTTPTLAPVARAAAARVDRALDRGEGSVAQVVDAKHVVGSLPVAARATPASGAIRAGDPALIAFSSGTTGMPKAAVLTHGGLVANLRQAAAGLPLTPDDVLLALAPFAHVMGVCGLLLRGTAAGATVVSMAHFEPQAFLAALSRHRVTQTIVPPLIVDLLARSPEVDRHDLSALRVVYVGGAGADADIERACAQRLGCAVAQGYGMTEGGPMIAVNPIAAGSCIRHGSAGLALPGVRIHIADPQSGEVLGVGATGEVRVASPALMAGYLGDSEATALTIDAAGWLHTGDLGYLDGEGYLWITDRLKDLIKHKGHHVAPAEVEAALRKHPAVADAAVVGRPDRLAGEVPVAFVTLRAPATADELTSFVAAHVSPPKRVHEVRVLDAIPRSLSGKILRRELRRLLEPPT